MTQSTDLSSGPTPTIRSAAAAVLSELGPLHSRDLTRELLQRHPGISTSKTPEATVVATLVHEIKRKGKSSTFVRVKPGVYGLRHASPEPLSPTPEAAFKQAANRLRADIEAQVRSKILAASPDFLERAVVDLLIAMGYGGGDPARGWVTGGTGDGGIDGTIREDALGLDEIFVQAKRYAVDHKVGERSLRNFAGALLAKGMNKGVFVTTSAFTSSALAYVEKIQQHIVLIDGEELANLLVTYGIGVRVKSTYAIKRIDDSYFELE